MATFRSKALLTALADINILEDPKLSQLTLRVAQHLNVSKDCHASADQIFTEIQLSKLENSLNLTRDQVKNVVSSLSEVVREAAYHGLSPEQLSARLISCEVDQTKARVIAAAWNEAKSTVTEALADIPVMPQLSYIGYSMTTEAGSDCKVGDINAAGNTRGILHLGLTNAEPIITEFTHAQLADFHSQLNRIQAQLDAIADK